jgi:hypothetical protein
MTSYRVAPDQGGWKVMRASDNGKAHSTVSKHQKKSAAKRKARALGSSGDLLTIIKSNGAIQTSGRIR